MSLLRCLGFALLLSFLPAFALADEPSGPPVTATEQVVEKCEHGARKTLCTRCNPKLEAVYKSKGDWCAEHTRAESQCVICNPELAEKGIK